MLVHKNHVGRATHSSETQGLLQPSRGEQLEHNNTFFFKNILTMNVLNVLKIKSEELGLME